MAFCLLNQDANRFLDAIKSGELDPIKLAELTSAERRAQLGKIVGEENAFDVNALFESKLLLKNQQQGMINWIEKTANLKPQVKKDLLTKIQKLEKVLDPVDKENFLADLSEQRLGVKVTPEEAKQLVDFSKNIETAKSAITENSPIASRERLEYGLQKQLFAQYVEQLKTAGEKPYSPTLKGGKKLLGDVVGTTKYIASSLDNSFQLAQNIKSLYKGMFEAVTGRPQVLKAWAKNFIGSWDSFIKEVRGIDAMTPIKADVFSRPNALNGKYDAMGKNLNLGISGEEAFPKSKIASKLESIPMLGRLFKGSEAAFSGTALKMRADLADIYIKRAEEAGIDTLNKAQMEPIGQQISSLTGRGDIGKLEAVGKEINTALFSIKFLKSNFDTLTGHQFASNLTPYARKTAAMNTAKIITTLAGVYAVANLIKPGSVELDPTKSNFGKIKIGDNYFDPTGKVGSLAVLAARMVTGKYTSNTGKVTDLWNPKFGESNRFDVVVDFFSNKASPIGGVLIDTLKGRTFTGEKPTVGKEALRLITPIPVQTFNQIRQTDASVADKFGAMLLDALGLSSTPVHKKK